MKKIKFSSINKRHLTLAGLVVVVAIAGYVNVQQSEPIIETTAPVETIDVKNNSDDEYTLAIMERDKKRSESIDVCKEILNNSNCDAETKDNAQKLLTSSAKYINDENTIENSLKAKNIEKSVVYIDEKEVRVIVYEKELDESTVSQIKDVVEDVSGFTAEKIKIIQNN
ncbi:MAG: SpoIIIAH-like family protein [Clostridia bacterium]|nr:SpoIIIAH-like family protein [Clostridia bacterium]